MPTAPLLATTAAPPGTGRYFRLVGLPGQPEQVVQPDVSASQAAAPWDAYAFMDAGELSPAATSRRAPLADKTISFAYPSTPLDMLAYQFVSPPLVGSGVISGTAKGQIMASEGSAAADMRIQGVLRVCSYNGATVRGTLYAGDTSALSHELATTLTNRRIFPAGAVTLSPVAYQPRDRVVLEVGARMMGATGTYAFTLRIGDQYGVDLLPEDETFTGVGNPWLWLEQAPEFETPPWDFRSDWELNSPTGYPYAWRGAYEYKTSGTPPISDQINSVSSKTVRPRIGTRSGEFKVRPGDQYSTTSGERALGRWFGGREDQWEGAVKWYAGSVLFPANWISPADYAVFWEIHTEGAPFAPTMGGYGAIQFGATLERNYGGSGRSEGLHLALNTGLDVNGDRNTELKAAYEIYPTLSKGLWNDLVWRIEFRRDATGAVDVWHRIEGERLFRHPIALRNVPTLNWRTISGAPHVAGLYHENGLYRGGDPSDSALTNIVYQSDYLRGDTFDAVNAWGAPGGPDGPAVANEGSPQT